MLKVLIVDSPGHFRDGMSKNLREAGLNVTTVDSLEDVARDTKDITVLLWHADLRRTREFVMIKRLLAANELLRCIVLVDQPSQIMLDASHNSGAQGLLLNSTPTPLMKGTIQLIALGGVAFPAYQNMSMSRPTEPYPVAAARDLLTPQQLRLVLHLAGDLTNEQIATALGVAVPTIKKHLKDIHHRLGASSRAGVVAICAGLKPPGVPSPRVSKAA